MLSHPGKVTRHDHASLAGRLDAVAQVGGRQPRAAWRGAVASAASEADAGRLSRRTCDAATMNWELAVEESVTQLVAVAFGELALAI
jgi:hypothetical protein